MQEILGHSSLKTTGIYADGRAETKRKALQKAFDESVDSYAPDTNRKEIIRVKRPKLNP